MKFTLCSLTTARALGGAGGAIRLEAAKLAPIVDQVLSGQLERLQRYSDGAGK